jgi:hypothetical protein
VQNSCQTKSSLWNAINLPKCSLGPARQMADLQGFRETEQWPNSWKATCVSAGCQVAANNQSITVAESRADGVCRKFAQGSAQQRGKPERGSATGDNEMLRTTRRCQRLLPAGSNPGGDRRVGLKHFCHIENRQHNCEQYRQQDVPRQNAHGICCPAHFLRVEARIQASSNTELFHPKVKS